MSERQLCICVCDRTGSVIIIIINENTGTGSHLKFIVPNIIIMNVIDNVCLLNVN